MAEVKNIDLKALHDAINARLSAAFPDCHVFTDYRRFEKTVPTPAILVELAELPTSDLRDTGTGQYHVDLMFEARCVCRNLDGKGTLAVRALALAVAGYIHETKWGIKTPGDPNQSETEIQPVSPALVAGAFPDVWEPDIDTYESFRVEWEHSAYAGVDAFIGPHFLPDVVEIVEKVGFEPVNGRYVLENNSFLLLEDGVDRLLLEGFEE